MQVCRYGLVSGLVQGVGFRAYVQGLARAAGLGGYARNLPDGRVEVLLCGAAEDVAEVEAEIIVGPPAAQVNAVQWESRSCINVEGFTTGWN